MLNILFAIPKGIAGLLIKVIVSPFTVWVISLIITGDFRLAYLYAIIFYTGFSILSLVYNLLKNAKPTKILGFLGTSISSIFFIISLIIYWGIYILTWGTNFNLN
jgi:hypothetical protein